jgi:hypothetical protein
MFPGMLSKVIHNALSSILLFHPWSRALDSFHALSEYKPAQNWRVNWRKLLCSELTTLHTQKTGLSASGVNGSFFVIFSSSANAMQYFVAHFKFCIFY